MVNGGERANRSSGYRKECNIAHVGGAVYERVERDIR